MFTSPYNNPSEVDAICISALEMRKERLADVE
jgi:hypothetical protein